jgi:hypothetical protein
LEPSNQGKEGFLSIQHWFHDIGYIDQLTWDLNEWIWDDYKSLNATNFFGYSSKQGYRLSMQQS